MVRKSLIGVIRQGMSGWSKKHPDYPLPINFKLSKYNRRLKSYVLRFEWRSKTQRCGMQTIIQMNIMQSNVSPEFMIEHILFGMAREYSRMQEKLYLDGEI